MDNEEEITDSFDFQSPYQEYRRWKLNFKKSLRLFVHTLISRGIEKEIIEKKITELGETPDTVSYLNYKRRQGDYDELFADLLKNLIL